MKKTLFMLFIGLFLNASTLVPANQLSQDEEFEVRNYLKTVKNFNPKYIKLMEKTSKKGIYAVHISAGVSLGKTFYIMPEMGFHSLTMFESSKLEDTPYQSTSNEDFNKKLQRDYLALLNTQQTQKEIFELVPILKNETEISIIMFADDSCAMCKEAYDFLNSKDITYKKIYMNKTTSEKEFIKSAYSNDLLKYKKSKFLITKLQILSPPSFLIYNNFTKEFIGYFPFFNEYAKQNFLSIAQHNTNIKESLVSESK